MKVGEKVTERDVLDALGRRYTHVVGNGERWVRAEHVRNGTGFFGYSEETFLSSGRCVGPLRTADFIAIDGWESKKHVIHGHEVKVSRSDWLHELKDPEKAEAFRPFCDYWWLVVSDKSIVRDDLPEGWGLMVVTNGVARVVKQAKRNERRPLPWPMVIGLARAIQKTAIRMREVA